MLANLSAARIAERDRLRALPRHFGVQSMLRVESAVYAAMRDLAPEYQGGYWHYYELSNGRFYIAPDASAPFEASVDGNGFRGSLSPDVACIVASLFGISRVANAGCEKCIEQLPAARLRGFARRAQRHLPGHRLIASSRCRCPIGTRSFSILGSHRS
jgi:hypothetical protein